MSGILYINKLCLFVTYSKQCQLVNRNTVFFSAMQRYPKAPLAVWLQLVRRQGTASHILIPRTLGEKGREVLGIFLGSIIKEREEWLGWALYKPHLFITPRSVTFSFKFLRCPHPHCLPQSLVQLSSPLFLHHYTPWLKDTPCHTYWAAQTHPWTPPTGAWSTGERLNMPEPTKKGENEFL